MGKWFQDKNFSTEKRGQGIKARKGHRGINARKIHRALGILLAAALVFQAVPFNGIAVSASESSGGGLCEHHRSHTEDCGYKEEEAGHACTHEHTEDCYRTVEGEDGSTTKELDCHHIHDESCGYREEIEGSPCTFVCGICNEGTDGIPEDNTDGDGINDGDSENPGIENGDEIEEPGDGQEENKDQQEDTGLCKHHREHDDACGYQPGSEDSEGSSCTYECRICPIEDLIADLPDAADITEDNVAEVRAQLEEILALYRELTEDEQEQIDLFHCYALQEVLDKANAPVTAEEIPADAVVKIEKEGIETVYVTEDELDDAFSNNSYAGATFTLLKDVKRASCLDIEIDCTLDLGGHDIKAIDDSNAIEVITNVIIEGKGEVFSANVHALSVVGTVTLKGGTFTSNGENYCGVFVSSGDAALSVTGENVVIQNTKGYGLGINSAQSVQLSAGKYSGAKGAIISSASDYILGDLLGHTGDTRYAYFNSTGTTPFTGKLEETLLTDTVTVGVCEHTGAGVCEYTHTIGTTTHQQTCLACGLVESAEKCSFDGIGKCSFCDAVLAVDLPADLALTYAGTEQKPDVIVMVDGQTLTAENDYTVTYANNVNAGNTAKATVTGTAFEGTVELPFSIDKATPTVAWKNNELELTYTGQPADIEPTVTLVNSETFSGTITYAYGVYSGPDRPTDAASYTVKASIPEQDNYTAAESDWLILYINPADQAAPAAPTATEENIRDNSITLDTIENAEYKKDDGEWQESPMFTGLNPNQTYTFYARLKGDYNHNASPSSMGKSITTKKTTLNGASVTVSGSYTYTGAAVVPAAGNVTVILSGTKIDPAQYTISAANNIHAGTATVTVTAAEGGKYSGSASTIFLIGKAALTIKAGDQSIICGDSITQGTGQVTHSGLCGGDTLRSITLTASTTDVPGGDITPSAAQIKNGSNADVTANYNITYQRGKLTVSYMEPPAYILYNSGVAKEWYNEDVKITADGYTVSDTLGGDYQNSYTISAQEGTVAKTLYFKDAANGHMSDGVPVTVKFDLTPPTGSISVGAKAWDRFLEAISFGHYKAKEYAVTIKAEDKNGSGIDKTEYVIVTGTEQYTETGALEAANLSWADYASGKLTVPAEGQYVVYARLTDNAGNVTYISTDGILLDSTPPTVGNLSVPEDTLKDVTAGFTFTVSEAADYYYVVLPQNSAAPSANDIIVTCGGILLEGTGTAIAGTFPKGSGAVSADTPGVSVDVKNLSPNTAYVVYVTAVDRAVDITDSAEGKPTGNLAAVVKAGFTTKKTLPTITEAPKVTGTYGQNVGEMTVTGGTAKDGNTVLTGTWAVSDTDKDKMPSAGTADKVTVAFTPDSDSYDSVSVQITPAVSPRSLNAPGVTVSEVAGTFTYNGSEIKPPVAVGTGTPVSGIFISDSGAALTANDFTVAYSNNKDAGTASVTITGKGNYTGSVTRTFTIGKAPGRTIPDLTGSHTDNGQTYTYTITPTEGAVYRMGDDGAWQEGNVFKEINPGTSVTFYAKMPEDKNYEDGTPKSITVDFPKLTPAAPALSYQADRTNPADVKVTITPVSGAEYSFDGGKTWTDSNEQGGFTTSQTVVLAIRLKETATHNQSPAQTVTVNLAKKDREAPPAFTLSVEANGETDYTVTIPATEGCEYSFDGEHWSDVNGKTDVKVGETVTGYKRYKETNDYNASSSVSASKTMEKFTVKTPVISPAGGSYTGNVSVTITCASPDAEIYYTTDGSTPNRSSARYIGAFTVTAPATVKAIAVKDGLTDSAVATASYTKKSSGGSGSGGNGGGNAGDSGNNSGGGNSGDNGNNGGQGSGGGGSTNPGNGSTTSQIPVTPPAQSTNPGNGAAPGTGTTLANSGNGNAVRPGTNRNSGAGTPAQGTKQPFIKGEDGKIGWNVIRAEEEKAEEGSVINVDMNGSVVVPGDIFDRLKGKDITITFDMGSGIIWSVDGKSITTDKAGDIDFSVKKGVNTVPVDIVNNVTGESYSIQISLAYEGEFGFTAVLSINLGKENAGYTASLYYYNESTGELVFICSDEVAQDGTVSLAFTHASDYVIAIDGDGEKGDGAAESVQPEGPGGTAGNGTAGNSSVPESPGTGQTGGGWWMIAILLFIAVIGAGIAIAVVREKRKGNS